MIRVTILYRNEGKKFDFEYYEKKHIPLVHKLLEPFGLVRTELDRGIGTIKPGDPPPYIAMGHMVFNSIKEMQAGLQKHDPDLAADVANFTDIKPEFQISELID